MPCLDLISASLAFSSRSLALVCSSCGPQKGVNVLCGAPQAVAVLMTYLLVDLIQLVQA